MTAIEIAIGRVFMPSSPPRLLNRKARHLYHIHSTLEAGIVLQGTEVKSLRLGQGQLVDAYADEKGGEIFLNNVFIPEYREGIRFNHEPRRPRKLLLKRREIKKISGQIKRRGMTLIPLALYFTSKGKIKVEVGLASGKDKADKRETRANQDWQRQKERLLKTGRLKTH